MAAPALNQKNQKRSYLPGSAIELPSIKITDTNLHAQRAKAAWKAPRKPNRRSFGLGLVAVLLLVGLVVGVSIAGRLVLERDAEYGVCKAVG